MLDGGGGFGSTAGSDLERGVGALERFQERVNKLLQEFEDSAAGKSKVAAQTVSRTSLSGGNAPFAEADGLYTQYNRVHEALLSLSTMLRDQIEYLRIGVYGAAVGYDNVEDDMRRRFHAIDARIQDEQAKAKAQAQAQDDRPAEQQPTNDDAKSDSGWGAE